MRLLVAIAIGLLILAAPAGYADVSVSRGEITIPIYDWLPADSNPRFHEIEGQPIYPYPRLENLATVRTERTFRTITLENEYLRILCLPELCGRIHSVLDKTTGEEVFYRADVIKPGLISINGAWFPGGIEWNRGPYGHTLNMMLPLDATATQNADGSATLHISAIERTYRTRWRVELTLRPGSASLDQRIQLIQQTDTLATYYFWNCVGYACTPTTRFIMPVSLVLDDESHAYEPWPIHEGLDKSLIANYPHRNSVYPVGGSHDFFGAYDALANRGVVQWADQTKLTGKKLWTWGQDESGYKNMASMTDEGDGAYIEIQTGPTETQNDVGRFHPGQLIEWEEWWYPVRGLGPRFDFATKDAALSLETGDGGVTLRVAVANEFPEVSIVVSRAGKTLNETVADLAPLKSWETKLDSEKTTAGLKIEVRSREKNLLLDFTAPLEIPKVDPPAPTPTPASPPTIEDQLKSADAADKKFNRTEARATLQKILDGQPENVAALVAAGELDFRMGRVESAAELLGKARGLAPERKDAAGYLAGALLFLSRTDDSLRTEIEKLAQDDALSRGMAGRCWMRLGNYERAIEAFRAAHQAEPTHPLWKNGLFAALFTAGKSDEYKKLANKMFETDPLNPFPQVLMLFRSNPMHNTLVRNRDAQFGDIDYTLLETAIQLLNFSMEDRARRLLEGVLDSTADESPHRPTMHYLAAWLAERAGNNSQAESHLSAARKLPTELVFPSQLELLPALEWVATREPADARAQLYYACLIAGLHRIEDALPWFEKASASDPTLTAAWRTLGWHQWRTKRDFFKAMEYYKKAVDARPSDPDLRFEYAQVQNAIGNRAQAIETLEALPTNVTRSMRYVTLLGRLLFEEKQYDRALAVLLGAQFRLSYGLTEQHDIFVKIHLQRGEELLAQSKLAESLADFEAALTYPESLKVGREPKSEEAKAQYLRGKALHALNRPEAAAEAWKLGAGGVEGSEDQKKYRELCAKSLVEGKPAE